MSKSFTLALSDGSLLYHVKPEDVGTMRKPLPGEYSPHAKTVVNVGGKDYGVQDSIEYIQSKLQ